MAGQAKPQAPASKEHALPSSLQLQELSADRRREGTCVGQESQLQSPLGVGTQLPAPLPSGLAPLPGSSDLP